MPRNRVIERMRKGEKALGIDIQFYHDEVVELAGVMGLDYVHYDGQHGPTTPEIIDRMCRMCDGYGLTPTMRVPDHLAGNMLNYLDRGIRSIVVPNLETKEQAEALVKNCFFAPIGLRSFTGPRHLRFGLETDYGKVMREVNETFLLVPQLESITAYNNLDEILTVDHIEVFAGGPNDLAQSMGLPGQADHPDCLRETDQGTQKIHAAGKKRHDDITANIQATFALRDAMAALLKEHGRS